MGISVIESAGAAIPARQAFVDPYTGEVLPISARSRTPRSFMTAIRADIGESEGYKQALLRGEIGLQKPMGANVRGVDFITTIRVGAGIREIVCTDVKTSGVGRFPPVKSFLPGTWQTEVRDAVSRLGELGLVVMRTDIAGVDPFPLPGSAALQQLELLRLKNAIIEAFTAGRVRPQPRRLTADYSPAGQGVISGW